MFKTSINRRSLVKASAAFAPIAYHATSTTTAQQNVFGRIAFIKNGHIMQWSPDGVSTLREDGEASAPSWQPDGDMLIYVRRGGSYSNLITLDVTSGRTRRLTNSESEFQRGSQDYVLDSDWIVDPFWSESGIIPFAANSDDPSGLLSLWILRYGEDTMFPGPTDMTEPGQVEKVTADAAGKYACYTVTGEDSMSSYIGMRDLDSGQSWVVMEGAHGAYDGAISPNGRWVIGTIRDTQGENDLWLCNLESEESFRITNGEQASAVTWDFFGEAVAYLSFLGDGFSMRSFRIDFTGDEPRMDGDIQVLIDKDDIDSTSRLSWNR